MRVVSGVLDVERGTTVDEEYSTRGQRTCVKGLVRD